MTQRVRAVVVLICASLAAWTYAELWDTARRVGGGLTALGLVRDDRVAVFLDKRLETVASIFGTSAAGGVFVPVNPLLRPQQVGYILRDCSVSIVITTRERLQGLMDELTNCPSLEHVVVVGDEPDDGAQGATGRSMLIATHEMGFARDVAHRVCFLDAGRILEEGRPEQLFEAPREERTKQFLQRIVAAGRL